MQTHLCAAHLHWPNESYLTGSQCKRTAYEDLILGQFVTGFIANVLDTQHFATVKNWLKELGKTIKLMEHLSWLIARGAFTISMHKIEEETITWADSRALANNRLTYSQSAAFSGSVTMLPRNAGSPQVIRGPKKIICHWFKESSCPHIQDHINMTGSTLFRHICMYCHKYL